MNSSLSPGFSKTFQGIIWSIKIDDGSDKIFIEVRDEDSLEIYYYSIDLVSHSIEEIIVPDSFGWFTSMIGGSGQVIMFSQFENETNPGPAKLLVYDYYNGQVKHEIDDFLLESFSAGTIIGRKTTRGQDESVIIHLNEQKDRDDHYEEPAVANSPYFITDHNEDFKIITDFLSQFDMIPVKGADYFEEDSNIVFSFYVETKSGLERNLMWIQDGSVKLNLNLDSKLTGVSPESFITIKNRLIFVKNRNELQIYEM